MPNPALYGAVLVCSAAITTLLIVIGRWRVTEGMAVGLACGYWLLKGAPRLPPTQALDRLLVFVYPTLLVALAIASRLRSRHAPDTHHAPDAHRGTELNHQRLGWRTRLSTTSPALLTMALLLLALRVLLHGSTDLQATTAAQQALLWLLLIIGAVGGWLLVRLQHYLWQNLQQAGAPAGTMPAAFMLALLACGATIMLTGYVTGGAATVPFLGVICGAYCSTWRRSEPEAVTSIAAVGLLGLVSLTLLGRFFGGLSNLQALTLILSPGLLIVVRWLPGTNNRRTLLALLCVALPLALVVVQAKRSFDRKYEPQRFLAPGRSFP
ncbi:MAG: hypothetical protein ACKOUR_04680 [Planctomycetota bacterium]